MALQAADGKDKQENTATEPGRLYSSFSWGWYEDGRLGLDLHSLKPEEEVPNRLVSRPISCYCSDCQQPNGVLGLALTCHAMHPSQEPEPEPEPEPFKFGAAAALDGDESLESSLPQVGIRRFFGCDQSYCQSSR